MTPQASLRYVQPPWRVEPLPAFTSAEEREAWFRREYADYPEYLNLLFQGGVEFGAERAQGILL